MYHLTMRMTDAEDFSFRVFTLNNDGTVPDDFASRVFHLEVSQNDEVLFTLTEGAGLTPIDETAAVDVFKSAATHGLTPGRYDVGCKFTTTGTLVAQPFTGTLVVSEGHLS